MPVGCIRHPLIEETGAAHGFGTRTSAVPDGTLLPIQVHGARVFCADAETRAADIDVEADAIVSRWPGQSVAIVTADCVPILACSESGKAVAAIPAGWRGLAKGVVEAGIETLRGASASGERMRAVIGPHIGDCCYEVDAPVLDALAEWFGAPALSRASRETRPGHARLSLGELAACALERAGVAREFRGQLRHSCTSCESRRFFSFRREAGSAGRMRHFIATAYP